MTASTHPFPADAADKRMIALKFWMQGAGLHLASRALDFNRRLFTGVRKDGLTPEFDHHVCQAQFLRTLLPTLLFPQESLSTIFFHDTSEDRGLSFDEIRNLYPDSPAFGDRVALATQRLTKEFRGTKMNEALLFEAMALCPIASIVKGCDRIHNLQSMVGVFSLTKQKDYLKETERLILPMLKAAEQRFPEQEPAYKNIRTVLKMQVHLIGESLTIQENNGSVSA